MVFIEVMTKDINEDEQKYIKSWLCVSIKYPLNIRYFNIAS